MRHIFLAILFAASSLSVHAATEKPNWTASALPGEGSVEFLAVGRPSALKIRGKGLAPTAELKKLGDTVSGVFSFDLSSLDTEIKLRNEHMKNKYLETDKFPKATLKLTALPIPSELNADSSSSDAVPFEGILLLHGVERPVKGEASVHRQGSRIDVGAKFKVRVSDYAINVPSFAGITMTDEVDINVRSLVQIQ